MSTFDTEMSVLDIFCVQRTHSGFIVVTASVFAVGIFCGNFRKSMYSVACLMRFPSQKPRHLCLIVFNVFID